MGYNEIVNHKKIGEINMKVNPYLSFNGNCAEAVAFYEKAFNVKAVVEIADEANNLVAHAEFEIDGTPIMLFDAPQPVKFGDNIMIIINFDKHERADAEKAFNILKADGNVIMELGETEWSECFGLLVDKFGIQWNICQN